MGDDRPALGDRIARVLALDPSARALEFEHTWHTWGELDGDRRCDRARCAARASASPCCCATVRRRSASCSDCCARARAWSRRIPSGGRSACAPTSSRSASARVAGESADLEELAPKVRWFASDALGAVAVTGEPPAPTTDRANRRPGVAVEMLTSGTTGPPKRVPLTYETFSRVLDGAKHYERNPNDDVRLRSGVTIVNSPMVHLGGLFRLLQCVNDGRVVLLVGTLPRRRVERRGSAPPPRTVSLVPAALRMVLDADLDRADLASVRSVISGTAPLAPDDADAFFEKYGVPVLISYAATEFGGGVAGWNLADHEQYWATKRGSVGRAHAGCELRVVDADTGAPLGADEEGSARGARRARWATTRGWTRTTDLARIDADGFVWILGRADQAIIRGGFKIRPDDVRAALERDPRVRGAAVVSRPDARLGAVPVAAVELRGDDDRAVSADDLLDGSGQGARALRAARRAAARRDAAAHTVGQGRPRGRPRAVRCDR